MKTIVIGILSISAAQLTEKYTEINKEIELNCPPGFEKPITWSYASNRKSAQENDLDVFYTNGKFSFSHPQVQHLEEQVSSYSDSNLLITPTSFSSNGVYRCKSWSSQQSADYLLKVYSIPSAEITTSQDFILFDTPTDIKCSVEGGEPTPIITWYVNGSPVSEAQISNADSKDIFTSMTTITSTATLSVQNSGEVSVECKITSQGLPEEFSYEGTTAQKIFRVESAPREAILSRNVVSNDREEFINCDAEASPEAEYEWVLSEGFKNYSSIDGNELTLKNIPLNLNGSEITCIAKNMHGSTSTKEVILVVDGSLAAKSSFTSNKILFVGILVAIVILALIGGIVSQRRCSQQASYRTNEDKQATPDGISYEQNPEREALAPDEKNVQKELLM